MGSDKLMVLAWGRHFESTELSNLVLYEGYSYLAALWVFIRSYRKAKSMNWGSVSIRRSVI